MSTPLVIAPVFDFSYPKPSSQVTTLPITKEATTITTTLPKITPFIALQLRVAKLEQDMSEKYSVLPGPESIKNQESKKSRKEIIRIKREQGEKKQKSLYTIRSTDKVTLEEFDLKSALFKHMQKNRTANRNPANYHLYHALMKALIADEDAMDKEVKDKNKDHKRKHDSDDDDEDDDDDEVPSAGSNQGKSTKRRRHDSGASGSAQPPTKDDEQSLKKPPKSDASASKKHPALPSTRWKITDTRHVNVDSSMHRSDPESEQSEQSSDNIPMQDEGHVSNLEDTNNAYIPKVSTTTWFKPIPKGERPATPEPEWTIPPNDFPEPENNWENTYATTYQVPIENKLQRKTYDIGSFIKWFCRLTGKKKLCKADLEGPALLARKTVILEPPMPAFMEPRITEHVAAPTPPLHVVSPPLPLPSPLTTSPTDVGAPLGYRVAGIRMRAASPLLLLPSISRLTDIPKAEMPPQKRACLTTPAPGLEIGESSVAGAARQLGTILEAELRRDRVMETGYGITDTWDATVKAMLDIAPTTLEGTQLTTMLGRIKTLEARDLEPQDEPAEAGSSY
ncbi:hypothetical protein Tco_0339153 [Tanacetum coccineum]